MKLELHLLARRLNVDALELERVRALRLDPEGERRQCRERQGSDRRRSYLESNHAFYSLWPQFANANEAGRSI